MVGLILELREGLGIVLAHRMGPCRVRVKVSARVKVRVKVRVRVRVRVKVGSRLRLVLGLKLVLGVRLGSRFLRDPRITAEIYHI